MKLILMTSDLKILRKARNQNAPIIRKTQLCGTTIPLTLAQLKDKIAHKLMSAIAAPMKPSSHALTKNGLQRNAVNQIRGRIFFEVIPTVSGAKPRPSTKITPLSDGV
jgi:hypothetical protein